MEQKLDRLAEVAVKIGLGLQPGQEMLLTAPVDAMPLVRRITEHAYKVGALLVTTFYADDPAVLAMRPSTMRRYGCTMRLRRHFAGVRRGWRSPVQIRRC